MKKNHDNVLHILDEYQEIVRQTRKAKNREIPDRFKNKGNFYSKEDLDCTKTFEVNMHFHFDDKRRQEETNKLTTNLTDSDTYAQEEIRKLTKLMSEESSEVEKEYDPKNKSYRTHKFLAFILLSLFYKVVPQEAQILQNIQQYLKK